MIIHLLKNLLKHLKILRLSKLDICVQKSDVYFEDGANKIFPNGTIIYDDGSQIEASVFFGAIDPK